MERYATRNVKASLADLLYAAKLISSIFTVNFCEIERNMKEGNKIPYVLLVVGGESHKALPLQTILERWKDAGIINGLVTSEQIAQRIKIKKR